MVVDASAKVGAGAYLPYVAGNVNTCVAEPTPTVFLVLTSWLVASCLLIMGADDKDFGVCLISSSRPVC